MDLQSGHETFTLQVLGRIFCIACAVTRRKPSIWAIWAMHEAYQRILPEFDLAWQTLPVEHLVPLLS
jgi:hypothetical protein